jgi:hypothetical protein
MNSRIAFQKLFDESVAIPASITNLVLEPNRYYEASESTLLFVLGSSMISLGADNPLNEEAFRSRSRLRLAELPAYFIENCGQWNDSIRLVAGKGPWSACFENHAIECVPVAQRGMAYGRLCTMWWRARANDASGSPGNWSSIRRFEVKN